MSQQGKGKTQYELTTIFPVVTFDKQDQQEAVLHLINSIVTLTGGASVVDQTGYERWDDGTVYMDVSKRVITIVDDVQIIAQVRDICLEAIEILHQRGGIFFQIIGNGHVIVEFLDRTDTVQSSIQKLEAA